MDSEGSSQDADEEDVGEDEDQDQGSDTRALTEETSSEITITTPIGTPPKPSDQLPASKVEANSKNPELNKTGSSLAPASRLPTNRSMIIGVPVQMLRTSSSSSNTSARSWESDNQNNLARRAARLAG